MIVLFIIVLFVREFVKGIQPCSTLISSQINTTLIASETPSNNCQYDALVGSFSLTGEMTFGLPIEPGTTSIDYFKLMNVNIENIDGLTIDLTLATNATTSPSFFNYPPTVYMGQIPLSPPSSPYDYIVVCNLKQANVSIPYLGCSSFCAPSGCVANTYECTFSTGGLAYYTVSEDEMIVIQVVSDLGRYPLWLASVTVQMINAEGSFQSLPITTGLCNSNGVVAPRNNFKWPNMVMTQSESLSRSFSHPITSSPSHSHSTPLHTPHPSHSHTAGCAHYPFNDQDDLSEPYFRVADHNYTIAYTALNPQCQPTLVWQSNGNESLMNAYGYSPYMTLAFPFTALGIDPNNESEYVRSFEFSMQNDQIYVAGISVYYQSSCGRFLEVDVNGPDTSEFEGGTDCNGGHVWANFNLRYYYILEEVHQVFREGYERDWGQQDSFVIMITNPDPSQIYYITNFTITMNTGRSVNVIPFYPVDPYVEIDYSDYCPFNHSILIDPPASFVPCRCNACSKEGSNIYFMPPIEVTQSFQVITNPLEYQNELDYYLAREGKGKGKGKRRGGDVFDESSGPLFRTEFDTFNFLNPVDSSRQEELLDMDKLMDDNGCGVLVFVRDSCMGNLEMWFAPELSNKTYNSSNSYLDYKYQDVVGFECTVVQAISQGTVTNLAWPLTNNVIVEADENGITHTPTDYGEGVDQRDWQYQPRFNVYFSGGSGSFEGQKYGFIMQRSNPDNFTGFYVSCDTSLPNYGGPDNLFVPLFSGKNVCVLNGTELQKSDFVEDYLNEVNDPSLLPYSNVKHYSRSTLVLTATPTCLDDGRHIPISSKNNVYLTGKTSRYVADYSGPALRIGTPLTHVNGTDEYLVDSMVFNLTFGFDSWEMETLFMESNWTNSTLDDYELYADFMFGDHDFELFVHTANIYSDDIFCGENVCQPVFVYGYSLLSLFGTRFAFDDKYDHNVGSYSHGVLRMDMTECFRYFVSSGKDIKDLKMNLAVNIPSDVLNSSFPYPNYYEEVLFGGLKMTIETEYWSDYRMFYASPNDKLMAYQPSLFCDRYCPLDMYLTEDVMNGDATIIAKLGNHPKSGYYFDDVFGIYAPQIPEFWAAAEYWEQMLYTGAYGFSDYQGNAILNQVFEMASSGSGFGMRYEEFELMTGHMLNYNYLLSFDEDVVIKMLRIYGLAISKPFQPGVYLTFDETTQETHIFGVAAGFVFIDRQGRLEDTHDYNDDSSHPIAAVAFGAIGFFDLVIPTCKRDYANEDGDVVCGWPGPLISGSYISQLLDPTQLTTVSLGMLENCRTPMVGLLDNECLSQRFMIQNKRTMTSKGSDPIVEQKRAYFDGGFRMGDGVDDMGMMGALPIIDSGYYLFDAVDPPFFSVPNGRTQFVRAIGRFMFSVFPCGTECLFDATHRLKNHPDMRFGSVVPPEINVSPTDFGDIIDMNYLATVDYDYYGSELPLLESEFKNISTSYLFDNVTNFAKGAIMGTKRSVSFSGDTSYFGVIVNFDAADCLGTIVEMRAPFSDMDRAFGAEFDSVYNNGMYMDARNGNWEFDIFGSVCVLVVQTREIGTGDRFMPPVKFFPLTESYIVYGGFYPFTGTFPIIFLRGSASVSTQYAYAMKSFTPLNTSDIEDSTLVFDMTSKSNLMSMAIFPNLAEDVPYDIVDIRGSGIFRVNDGAVIKVNDNDDVEVVGSVMFDLAGLTFPDMLLMSNIEKCGNMFDDSYGIKMTTSESASQSPIFTESESVSPLVSESARDFHDVGEWCCERTHNPNYANINLAPIGCDREQEEGKGGFEVNMEGMPFEQKDGGICSAFDGPQSMSTGFIYQLSDQFLPWRILFNKQGDDNNDNVYSQFVHAGIRVGQLWLSFSQYASNVTMTYDPDKQQIEIYGRAYGMVLAQEVTCLSNEWGVAELEGYYIVGLSITTGIIYNEDTVNALWGEKGIALMVHDESVASVYPYSPYDHIERGVGEGEERRQFTLPPRTSPTNIGFFYPEKHPSAVMTFGMRNLEAFNENGIPVVWEDLFSNYFQMQMMIMTGGPVGNPVSGWQGIGVFLVTNAADTSDISSPHDFKDNIHLALSYYSNQIVEGLTPDFIEGSGWIAFTVESSCGKSLLGGGGGGGGGGEMRTESTSFTPALNSLPPNYVYEAPAPRTQYAATLPVCLPLTEEEENNPYGPRHVCGVINQETFPPRHFGDDDAISYVSIIPNEYGDYSYYGDVETEVVRFDMGTRDEAVFVSTKVYGTPNRVKIDLMLQFLSSSPLPDNIRAIWVFLDYKGDDNGMYGICNISNIDGRAYCGELELGEAEGWLQIGLVNHPLYLLRSNVYLTGVEMIYMHEEGCKILTVTYGTLEPNIACVLGNVGSPPSLGTDLGFSINFGFNYFMNFIYKFVAFLFCNDFYCWWYGP